MTKSWDAIIIGGGAAGLFCAGIAGQLGKKVLVYYWAGRKEDAIKQLKTVEAADGTALIARYWAMQINHPLAK